MANADPGPIKYFAILIPLFPSLISILLPALLTWLRPKGLLVEAERVLALVDTRQKLQHTLEIGELGKDEPATGAVRRLIDQIDLELRLPTDHNAPASGLLLVLAVGETIGLCLLAAVGVTPPPPDHGGTDSMIEGILGDWWVRAAVALSWALAAGYVTQRIGTLARKTVGTTVLFAIFNAVLLAVAIVSAIAMRLLDPIVNWW